MRTAILVNTPVDKGLREQIRAGNSPQRDFFALADALDATLIAPAKAPLERGGHVSKLVNLFDVVSAAFRQRHKYDLIISDVERVGIALALLFKLTGVRKRHIMICHGRLIYHPEGRMLQAFRLQTHIDRFVCYGPMVAGKLTTILGVPADQVADVRHPADHHFWRPLPEAPERLFCSAGLTLRDYHTLIEAVRGLDVSLVAAAYSPWYFNGRNGTLGAGLPPNVRFAQHNYRELRDLYARSLFVAIPLVNSYAQEGSLVMYEAMAMGKAVVATRTEAQAGLGVLKAGETGLFVEPGDVKGWRDVINHLCDHPEEAIRMGQRARTLVDEGLNMDSYVREMVRIVESVSTKEKRLQSS